MAWAIPVRAMRSAFCLGQGPDLGGLLHRALVFGLALVGLDGDAQLRFGDVALLFGAGLGLAQLALLAGGRLLAVVGFDLLDRDLARAQLVQDDLDLLVVRRWWSGVPISTSSSSRL